MIALKKPKATKFSQNCTISLNAHAVKIVVGILRDWMENWGCSWWL